jgi:hypothetical protein
MATEEGRVEIIKHGRLVAVVLSPRPFNSSSPAGEVADQSDAWGKEHMIPADTARRARMLGVASCFDEE